VGAREVSEESPAAAGGGGGVQVPERGGDGRENAGTRSGGGGRARSAVHPR